MHLVDFIIRICHDARSPERQKRQVHYRFFAGVKGQAMMV